jgi:hypothetical protein
VALSLLPLAALVGVWSGSTPGHAATLGEAVPLERAQSLSELFAEHAARRGAGDDVPPEVVVAGRVSEVCASSGCWFVLREVDAGRVHELFVDLSPRADFTASRELVGAHVVVSGVLVADGSNLSLHARGLLRP